VAQNFSAIADSSVTVSSDEIRSIMMLTRIPNVPLSGWNMVFEIAPSESDMKEAETWATNDKINFAAATDLVQYINLTADTRHTGVYQTLSGLPESLRSLAESGDKSVVIGPYFEDGSYKIARIVEITERPDSVRAAHILLSPNAGRSMAQARKEADSLLQLINKGIEFDLLAMANSDDQGSAQVGGDLGWFSEGMMIAPFNNACFSGKKGDLVTVETTFGLHIIRIIDQSRRVRKYDIGVVDRKVIPSSVTNQRIYAEASQFAGTNNTYEKFNKAVAAGSLNKKLAMNVTPEQKELPGLTQARGLVMALFQNNKEGSIIPTTVTRQSLNLKMYMLCLLHTCAGRGYSSVESVSSDIRFILAKKKKAEVISGEMKKLAAEGKTIYDVASHYNTTVQDASGINFRSYSIPGAGIEPGLIAAASASEAGVLSKPVAGINGVYMFVVNTAAPAAAEDIAMVRERLNSNYQIRASYEAYQAIRDKKEVVDMRYKFY
jgi:peptidyl-prolyl cis-trans isomerase D